MSQTRARVEVCGSCRNTRPPDRTCSSGGERETIRAAVLCRPREGASILDATGIAAIYLGFREGRAADVEVVQGWIRSVVHGGNWRFRDPRAVVQEVLLELVRISRSERIQEAGSFLKLVQTVSKNVCVDTYHRERKGVQEPLDADHSDLRAKDDPEARIRAKDRLSALRYVLQRLGDPCRELWALVYGERLSSADVARRLGTTDGNVRVRMHRCLEKARETYREFCKRSPA